MSLSRRRVLKTLLLGMGVVCASSAVPRRAEAAKRVRRNFTLFPTVDGLQIQARGKIRVEAKPSLDQERITVRVEARGVAPGSQVDVYGLNPTVSEEFALLGVLTLGAFKKNRVRGDLEFKNFDGGTPIPPELSPVAAITEFIVTPHESGTVLLQTSFDPPGGGGGGGTSEITLVPTAHGAATGTTGNALTAMLENRQKLVVEIESTGLPANTAVEVRFSHAQHGANLFAGQFILLQRNGRVGIKIEWDSLDGPFLPGQAMPVDQITSISVIRLSNGEVLLTGVF